MNIPKLSYQELCSYSRVTALSDRGVIIPGKVTIQGIFIESPELENASHVTGNHKTLGYSIADFINVFQVGFYLLYFKCQK